MSKVFVITPTYCTENNGRLPLLLQTIYWVKQQTHENYLHIIVDDGSTDSAPDMLARLSRSDSRLVVFSKNNGGSSEAINYGVEQALLFEKPDYITVCHSDDLLLPHSLDVRVQHASKRGVEFVYSDELVIFDNGFPPKCQRANGYSTPHDMYEALLQHHWFPYVSMLWTADFFLHKLQGYDPRLTSAEDWDIALRSAKILTAMQGSHDTVESVTVARRVHQNRLRTQNILDGTKLRCYEMILRKHLGEEDFQAAIARVKMTKLKPPNLLARIDENIARFQRLALLRSTLKSILRLTRRAFLTKTQMDPLVETFLSEMDKVDYDLIIE